jgi:LEA14-like dessication related protein
MLDSFRAIPSEGMTPRFALGLRVVNPNSTPLPLRGMSYNVEFEGYQVITGVAGNLATVPAYGESLIEVQAGVDLISGLRLFNDLLQDPQRDRFRYNLRARLDTGGISRFLVLEESGELSLASLQR